MFTIQRDKGTKLGIYTKDHGFMSVNAFKYAMKKGAIPHHTSGIKKAIKPVQVSAVMFRAIETRRRIEQTARKFGVYFN